MEPITTKLGHELPFGDKKENQVSLGTRKSGSDHIELDRSEADPGSVLGA